MSVVTRITQLPFSIIIGFGQGFQPVCGYNYGAKKYDRVLEGFYFTALVSICILLTLSSICFIFSDQLIMLFCQDKDKIQNLELFLSFGSSTLKAHCLTLPLMAINGTSSMLLQTTGKSIRASTLAVSRQGLFFVPFLFILGQTVEGIKYVQVFADICTLIITIIVVISIIKELKFMQKTQN